MTTLDEQFLMAQDCENRESKLSDWERKFIDSLSKQMLDGHTLSKKQAQTLDNIWEKVT